MPVSEVDIDREVLIPGRSDSGAITITPPLK
jgi:hypothetical protein